MAAGARGAHDAGAQRVADGLATYLDAADGAGGRPRQARYRVEASCTAQGLLAALVHSKPVVARAFEAGALARGGAALRRQDALAPGDVVTLALAPADSPHEGAGGAGGAAGRRGREEPRVLYRDPFLMAVDKPAGILVHGDGTGVRTLTDDVAALLAREGVPAAPQAVQRLDVDTTGVVLFSLAPEFQPALDALVASHDMRKRYLAVVEGSFDAGVRRMDAPLGRDRHDARRMRVSAGGKPALTLVTVLARRGGKSLLLLELGTGRRHQIRVHLAHAGHPIVGDALYGRAAGGRLGGRAAGAGGLMLHAVCEELAHPATGKALRLEAGWPDRFGKFFSPLDYDAGARC
ncbi:RluA family pseudouridine synthase [Parafannyhessea umbonata]|uniref:RluA family pseudouridine synthase n=1 Tax=Parafannyhessea umbonata TaxID=604330 RepID=UPI0026EE0C3F|nr:RluA family pseudouridine synthase [Parafannyhessea umbonata]MDD7199595.1 RluA family pseudouridine synthase [Parafannyhessea umbonata]